MGFLQNDCDEMLGALVCLNRASKQGYLVGGCWAGGGESEKVREDRPLLQRNPMPVE